MKNKKAKSKSNYPKEFRSGMMSTGSRTIDSGQDLVHHNTLSEHACRAGSTTAFSFHDDGELLCDYAWYEDSSCERPHPVALKKPNAWGLYDMHGNVWEWCSDW